LGASSSRTSEGRRQGPSAGALDETRFHEWLARRLRATIGPLPVGDDTAALPIGSGRVALLTSDALVEGYHFLRGAPPRSLGAAAASVNLSDVAAKGGRPVAFLLDLLLPPGTPESWARSVVDGAERQLARYGAHLVGGDTKPSPRIAIVGTLIGIARRDLLAPRTAARVGDRLVTTGTVGRGGLALLRWKRDPTSAAARAGLLRIRPRVREGAELARWAHAMMDTSDGVADSARLLASASRLRVVVEEGRLPIDPGLSRAVEAPGRRRRSAFVGGDYELLAALPAEKVPAARAALRRLGCPLTDIGRVEPGRGAWIETSGHCDPMPEGGWRPFRGR
jgi:thiamine-monophosphate kinase